MNVKELEFFVSNVLRIGVAVSGALILLGLAIFVVTGDASFPFGIATFHWIIFGDPFFMPSHILFMGFLTLVMTPLLRVATSVFAYLVEKDWIYAVITGFVLTVLVAGMILGLG